MGCGADAGKGDACVGDACGCAGDACCDPSTGCCGDACGAPPLEATGPLAATSLDDGRVAIATWDAARGALVVVLQRPGDSARSVVPVVTGPALLGDTARVAIGPLGSIHVAWSDGAAVRWAKGDETGFLSRETVAPLASSRLALRVDANSRPHVAFRDDATRSVRYAVRQGNGWQLNGVPGCAGEEGCPGDYEDYGQALDLALVGSDASPAPRIAFYDATRGDLKLAGLDQGTWTTITLDGRAGADGVDVDDVGRFLSLAVTPTRSLGVAYFDATAGALRYLGPSGSARVVDNGLATQPDGRARRSLVGQFCALAYDAQGTAHALYTDTSGPGLRHARIVGDGAAAITALPIPAGAWPWFAVRGDRLVGAYGAFVVGEAPATAPRLFDLPAGAGQ